MCNNVHKEKFEFNHKIIDPKFEEIKEEGIGYKLFNKLHSAYSLYPAFGFRPYSRDIDGWITWKKIFKGEGFCFFKTKKQAENALNYLSMDLEVRKIRYRKGLGSFVSPEMDGRKRRFYIAKEFKMEEENVSS